MDAQEIGTMIQRLREQQNLTQKALAERLAVIDKTGNGARTAGYVIISAAGRGIAGFCFRTVFRRADCESKPQRKPEKDGFLRLPDLRKCAVLDGRRCFQLLRHFPAEVTGRASDRHTYTHHSAGGI